ncbi:MAG: rod-binding protein [Anaerolineae bacterium]
MTMSTMFNPGTQASGAIATGSAKEPTSVEHRRLAEVCRQFEAVFLEEILKGLRKTVPKDDGCAAGGASDSASDLRLGMADQQMALHLAESGGIGLARMLYEQLVKQMEHERG